MLLPDFIEYPSCCEQPASMRIAQVWTANFCLNTLSRCEPCHFSKHVNIVGVTTTLRISVASVAPEFLHKQNHTSRVETPGRWPEQACVWFGGPVSSTIYDRTSDEIKKSRASLSTIFSIISIFLPLFKWKVCVPIPNNVIEILYIAMRIFLLQKCVGFCFFLWYDTFSTQCVQSNANNSTFWPLCISKSISNKIFLNQGVGRKVRGRK